MFAGWDWATGSHDVTVVGTDGARIDRWALAHTETGIVSTLARLRRHGDPAGLPVAIETTRGLVVDRLLAAGHPVIPIHPNAFNAVRPHWGAARAKNDPGDSFKLADYLRTDGHQLRTLAPTLPETLELQALTRQRADHVEARVAAVNQLAALLDEHWPGGKAIFASLDSDIALAFLDRYPTPESAAGLTAGRLEAFCKRHSYSGRRPGSVLLERLRAAPITTSRLRQSTLARLVGLQARLIRAIRATISELDTAIAEATKTHPWAELIAGLPRIGTINLGQIIGEIGPMLERATNCAQLAAETGAAPVTKESGKHRSVNFRYAVNRRARQALTTWADNSRHSSDWAATIYDDARARGKRHPHAVRILARAWLRIIWACWRDKTCYHPAIHHTTKKINNDQGLT
ncbi:MAG TPA: IS110 family transposase [Amycolatopsis sp.]|nr:IS110 family transposase [Amycolatopsis sp.]